jgi:hypothetical protein
MMMSFSKLLGLLLIWQTAALTPPKDVVASSKQHNLSRRDLAGVVAACSSSVLLTPQPSLAFGGGGGLDSKLSKRDPNVLTNSVFNAPPAAQVYPDFLRGTWDVTCKFAGYLFPSQTISRQRLVDNYQIPGFQKCSIAALCDVGKESVQYQMVIDPKTGLDDRVSTLSNQINANLGYRAVADVVYNVKQNPNRLSVDFVEYRTRNAERIELFCNARESELVPEKGLFLCSEYFRQVTFGTGSEVGIPRQALGNYAHFWTWRQNKENPDVMSGNLLTAVYLDPQDSMFFEEPSKPVAVYSHVLSAQKVVG